MGIRGPRIGRHRRWDRDPGVDRRAASTVTRSEASAALTRFGPMAIPIPPGGRQKRARSKYRLLRQRRVESVRMEGRPRVSESRGESFLLVQYPM